MNTKSVLVALGLVMLAVGVVRVVRKRQAPAPKATEPTVAAESAAQAAAAARQHIDVDYVGGVVH